MDLVTDGIRLLAGRGDQFLGRGQVLRADGVQRIGGVDQGGDRRGDGNGIAGRHGLQGVDGVGLHQAGLGQVRRRVQDRAHGTSATGVHMTSSIVRAPVASRTSRSKPRAAPEAWGMMARAARKSSSRG